MNRWGSTMHSTFVRSASRKPFMPTPRSCFDEVGQPIVHGRVILRIQEVLDRLANPRGRFGRPELVPFDVERSHVSGAGTPFRICEVLQLIGRSFCQPILAEQVLVSLPELCLGRLPLGVGLQEPRIQRLGPLQHFWADVSRAGQAFPVRSSVSLSQHPDEHRPERLLAVDQELGHRAYSGRAFCDPKVLVCHRKRFRALRLDAAEVAGACAEGRGP